MLAPDVLAYVRACLPPPPARVLEVGAGDGSLAEALRAYATLGEVSDVLRDEFGVYQPAR